MDKIYHLVALFLVTFKIFSNVIANSILDVDYKYRLWFMVPYNL